MTDSERRKAELLEEIMKLRARNAKLEIALSESRRETESLLENEESYRHLFYVAPMGIFRCTPEGKVIAANPSLARMFGFSSPVDFIFSAKKIGAYILSAPQSWEYLVRVLAESPDFKTFELTCRRREGDSFPGNLNIRAISDGEGRFLFLEGCIEDITERKQAEEALCESNELFSLYMRHSPIYTFIKTVTPTESRVLQASDNYQQMIGIPGWDMVGKTMAELFPAEFAAKITADDWAVVSNGEVLKIDEDLNGRNYTSIKFPIIQGDKTLLAGYTIDITERKQAEEALRESEVRFRTLFEESTDAISLYSPEGRKVNKAWLEMFGYTEDEVTSIDMDLLYVNPEDRARYLKEIKEKGFVKNFEVKLLRKDGAEITCLSSGTKLQGNERNSQYFQSFLKDISPLKKIMGALQESEGRYRSLFENMQEGFAYCRMIFDDKDRPVDFVYLAVNSAFERLTGLKNAQGKPVTELIPGIRESSPELFEIYGRVALTGQPEKFEIDFKPLSMWLSISVYSPEKGYFVAVFDNITESKRATQERERLIAELQKAFSEVKTLSGLLPICASCKKIRDDKGYWNQIEGYIQQRSNAQFSHGICPDCMKKLYPDFDKDWDAEKK